MNTEDAEDFEVAKRNRERIAELHLKEAAGEKPERSQRQEPIPLPIPKSAIVPKKTEPTPLESYEPGVTRDEFFSDLEQVVKPVKEKPPEGNTRGVYKKGKYLDEHRDEILADRLTIGLRSTLKKWAISSSTWRYIEKRWIREGYKIANIQGAEGHRGGVHEHKEKVIPIEEIKQVSSSLGETHIVPEESKQSKIRATFRWLVSEDIEPSYEMSDELLAKYLKEAPDETMIELQKFLKGKVFSVDELHRAMFSVYIEELLESMPDFKKTRSGEYQYKGK